MKVGYVENIPFPNTYMLTIDGKPLIVRDFITEYNLDEFYMMERLKESKWSGYGCPSKNIPNYAIVAWDKESLEKLTDLFTSILVAYKLKGNNK